MSRLRQALRGIDWTGWVGLSVVAVMLAAAIFAPLLAPYDPIEISLEDRLSAPSLAHWLGTDQAGRDVLSRIVFGARASLSIGIGAVLIGALIGVSAALFAAYRGGIGEQVVMRIVDGIASIPLLVWAIAIVVRPREAVSRACCTTRSEIVSSALVASSRMSTSGSLSRTRAMAMRCFSPPERR